MSLNHGRRHGAEADDRFARMGRGSAMSPRQHSDQALCLIADIAGLFGGRRNAPGIRPAMIALVLACCCVMPGCRTIEPANEPTIRTLAALQTAATPDPPDRVLAIAEHRQAKKAMIRWTERFLGHAYRVTDQRFVLLEPGFTAGAQIGSKAQQHVTEQLGGTLKTDGWYDDDAYMLLLWQLREGSPRYLAFVMTRDLSPGTERRLVGYFALEMTTANRDR
jgi:hypothetical protein